MLEPVHVPGAVPAQKVPGYRMPVSDQNLLSWDFVAAQLENARHYWISTNASDGRPHSVPLCGLWYHDRVHFEGRMETAWARHLVADPRVVIHPPDAEQVVIIEGLARIIEDDDLDEDEWNELDSLFQAKYDLEQGSPYWCVEPTKVLAWNGGGLETMTRWIFAPEGKGASAAG